MGRWTGWRCRAWAARWAYGECVPAAGVGVGLGLVTGGVAVGEGLAVRDGLADGDAEVLGRLVGDGELTGRFVGDGVAAGRAGAGLGVFCRPGAAARPAGDAAGSGRTSR